MGGRKRREKVADLNRSNVGVDLDDLVDQRGVVVGKVYVNATLRGVKRVGGGVRASNDAALLDRLIESALQLRGGIRRY